MDGAAFDRAGSCRIKNRENGNRLLCRHRGPAIAGDRRGEGPVVVVIATLLRGNTFIAFGRPKCSPQGRPIGRSSPQRPTVA